ncbi:uncharacterized protein A4U43_C05F30210 [Asparagus officinalis]|uniref:Uncharacterized protein n=1 Tax=Asparagus officinalis TaxID=4686 RepID=A0A5P1EVK0_ASPOF|nr:uncharacterized protein LOC109843498 [Asparagus officinalis]ONK70095.1 uncharacterized protein A4U43_C05F30210 [Asparagus officinalis]
MDKNLSDIELDFFAFGDESQATEHIDQWRSDGDGDGDEEEKEINMAETKAFWDEQHRLLQDALSRPSSTETRIKRRTEEIIRKMQSTTESHRDSALRAIVDHLRDLGYNSALCKSKWRRSPDIPSGEHNYIDVVVESKTTKKGPVRIIVEPNFKQEFEMARGNTEYNALVSVLPEIFVGKPERLRHVIKIMCGAAKKCMKDNKMHIAPWRKHKYVQSKWLGTRERVMPSVPTMAVVLEKSASPPMLRPRASMLTFDLHCQAVEVV